MMGQFTNSFNILFAPIATVIILIVDYSRRYVDDLFARKTFMIVLVTTLLAMLSELVYDVCVGMTGVVGNIILYNSSFLYFFFQVAAYYLTVLFIDYQLNGDRARTKKMAWLIGGVLGAHLLALILNGFIPFYFVITPGDNLYVQGDWYVVRLLFSYLPGVISFINLYASRKNVVREHTILMSLVFVLMATGSSLDLMSSSLKLTWPCSAGSLLFAYFFIIRAELHVDVLTGVNNRRSCEEYIRSITESAKHQDYHFIMLDLDGFKTINDSFGHVQGDQALRDTALLLRRSFRKDDFIARYGGDEFLVIAQTSNAERLVDRLQAEFAKFNSEESRVYRLEASIGHDRFLAEDVRTPKEFIAHVDQLMYLKKKQKREKR